MCESTQQPEDGLGNQDFDREFAVAKLIYKNHAELLYRLTLLDFKILISYFTLQAVATGWVVTNSSLLTNGTIIFWIAVIDIVIAVVAGLLIYLQRRRRTEVIDEIIDSKVQLGVDGYDIQIENGIEAVDAEKKKSKKRSYALMFLFLLLIGVALLGFIVILCVINGGKNV